MRYKVINEELKIASCGLADLTKDQVFSFLKQWDDDSSIGTLTLFYDRESGYVVLNRDNKNYKMYLDIADAYLGASSEGRQRIEENTPEGMRQTILVLKNSLVWRKVDRDIYQSKKNLIEDADRTVISEIAKQSDNRTASACIAFRYGVICGKRAERARRKKTA
nr:hypothetical protein [uncultured Anaerostipes sp.]